MDIEERDGDIRGKYGNPQTGSTTLDLAGIAEPRNATTAEQGYQQEVDEYFYQFSELENLLMSLMDAVGHGFSALEIDWHLLTENGNRKPLYTVRNRGLRLIKTTIYYSKPLIITKVSHYAHWAGWYIRIKLRSIQLARLGLYRTLAWHYMFKHYAVRLYRVLELYGMPIRIGKYGAGATNEEKTYPFACFGSNWT